MKIQLIIHRFIAFIVLTCNFYRSPYFSSDRSEERRRRRRRRDLVRPGRGVAWSLWLEEGAQLAQSWVTSLRIISLKLYSEQSIRPPLTLSALRNLRAVREHCTCTVFQFLCPLHPLPLIPPPRFSFLFSLTCIDYPKHVPFRHLITHHSSSVYLQYILNVRHNDNTI